MLEKLLDETEFKLIESWDDRLKADSINPRLLGQIHGMTPHEFMEKFKMRREYVFHNEALKSYFQIYFHVGKPFLYTNWGSGKKDRTEHTKEESAKSIILFLTQLKNDIPMMKKIDFIHNSHENNKNLITELENIGLKVKMLKQSGTKLLEKKYTSLPESVTMT